PTRYIAALPFDRNDILHKFGEALDLPSREQFVARAVDQQRFAEQRARTGLVQRPVRRIGRKFAIPVAVVPPPKGKPDACRSETEPCRGEVKRPSMIIALEHHWHFLLRPLAQRAASLS